MPEPHVLPLVESLLSTRKQSLPALLKTRSSASLNTIEQDKRSCENTVLFSDRFRSRAPRGIGGEIEGDRDMLDGAFSPVRRSSLRWEALNTPQMRSMRLIGNSNPRYQWYGWSKYFLLF